MAHGGGARRENRHVRTAFAQQFQLIVFYAFADLVVANRRGIRRRQRRIGKRRKLLLTKLLVFVGRGRVVAMAVDYHRQIS